MKDINIKIISKWIEQTLYINPEYQENILKSLIIILALVIIRFIVIRIADQKIKNQQVFYRFQKTTKYFFWFFLIVLVGRIWFQGIQSLATFLGLVSAGIAIALKDPLVNLAGWAFIFWQKPFEVGERIELAGVKGDVIDINTFQFDLLEVRKEGKRETNTGRIIHMPNGKIFTDSLSNYDKTFPFIWDVISTGKMPRKFLKRSVQSFPKDIQKRKYIALKGPHEIYI
jgi:small-conductance mechanosensitive channel